MSWQGYVDNLMATKTFTHVGIFGLDGNVWATTPGSPLAADQVKQVVSGITSAANVSNGVNLGADRYILVRGDAGQFLILKKNQNGLIGYKANTCVIVGLHDEKVKAEQALNAAGRVADYLTKCGY